MGNDTIQTSKKKRDQFEQFMYKITKTVGSLNNQVPSEKKQDSKRGDLIILGAGIASVGFTMDAEMYIRRADSVFYVVTDPVTEVWINKLRPDAYDLSTLYNDNKPRYNTYMQMTEAMLYDVRQGRTVVGIFYGHPGIFALSTHRAIMIARREGHRAVMKPGISALDCLCADLGVDPSYPGMQTMEATDMLLRGKKPDTTQHVILWQVGLIGIYDFRRRGFINKNFNIFIRFLQNVYGEDYSITHYVAASFPTLAPLIQNFTLRELLYPDIQAKVQSMSTFYLAPKDATECNLEIAIQLGMAKPDSKPWMYPTTKEIDAYGERELQAIRELADFRVPPDYQVQEETRAAEFILQAGQNVDLQELFLQDPVTSVSKDVFPGLNAWEQRLLSSRNHASIMCAVKGSQTPLAPSEHFIVDLLLNPELRKAYSVILLSNREKTEGEKIMNQWLVARGYQTNMKDVDVALSNVATTLLLPWVGVYFSKQADMVLTIISDSQHNSDSKIYLNNTRIRKFTFANSTLSFSTEDGNPYNAVITLSMPKPTKSKKFTRSFRGEIWNSDRQVFENNVEGVEISPTQEFLQNAVNGNELVYGQYLIQLFQDGTWSSCRGLYYDSNILRIGRTRIHAFTQTDNVLTWEGAGGEYNSGQLHVRLDPLTYSYVVSGFVWEEGRAQSSSPNIRGQYVPKAIQLWRGSYATAIDDMIGPTLHIAEENETGSFEILLGKTKVQHYTFQNNVLQAMVDEETSFEVVFQYSESTSRIFQGILRQNNASHSWTSQEVASTPEAWLGVYRGTFLDDDRTFRPSPLTLHVKLNNQELSVQLSNGKTSRKLSQVVFNSKHNGLAWAENFDTPEWAPYSNGLIKFYVDPDTGRFLFNGSLWGDDDLPPKHANWRGQALWTNMREECEGKESPSEVWNILSMLSLTLSTSLLGGWWDLWCSSLHATQFCYKQMSLLEVTMLSE
ncbi:SAM-dependent methyltransferase [Brevibacillus sp. VP]|uniref:SAM-dependent methyltransferase n=1 Tax=unclassified Brevibacillus TaxID=2684853 RepID=UPI000E2ED12A|nr:SAM-dependent methyltransferase [Brevibacillus sp. VP]RFB38100.1 hypothetical protein DZB91_04995 [Brevibacillus sp. VP]